MKCLIPIALCLLSTLSLFAQQSDISVLVKVNKGEDLYTIKYVATNQGKLPRNISYKGAILSIKGTNSQKINQEGLAVLGAGESKVLSSSVVNYNPAIELSIIVSISENGEVIASANKLIERQKRAINSDAARLQQPIELNGVVLDNTLTKAGRDFYFYFYQTYNGNFSNVPLLVDVKEIPHIANRTKVQIHIDDLLIFEGFTFPKDDAMQELSAQAISRVANYYQKLSQR